MRRALFANAPTVPTARQAIEDGQSAQAELSTSLQRELQALELRVADTRDLLEHVRARAASGAPAPTPLEAARMRDLARLTEAAMPRPLTSEQWRQSDPAERWRIATAAAGAAEAPPPTTPGLAAVVQTPAEPEFHTPLRAPDLAANLPGPSFETPPRAPATPITDSPDVGDIVAALHTMSDAAEIAFAEAMVDGPIAAVEAAAKAAAAVPNALKGEEWQIAARIAARANSEAPQALSTAPAASSTTSVSANFIKGADIRELPKIGDDLGTAPADRLSKVVDWIHESGATVAAMFPFEHSGRLYWKASLDHAVEQHLAYCTAARACLPWTYTSRPIAVDEAPVEARLAPLVLAALPRDLRARAVSAHDLSTDYFLHLLLTKAYRGSAQERTELLNTVTDVAAPRPTEDVEIRLEQWKRLVSYLPRFGIAVPDYGIMIGAANKIVAGFDQNPKFALDKALFVRQNGVDSIRYNDEALFDQYINHLIGLIRVAGGSVRKDRGPQAHFAGKGKGKGKDRPCKFFSGGLGCVHGKDCALDHSSRLEGACFKCGQLGHRAEQCPVVGCEPGKQPRPTKLPPATPKAAAKPPPSRGGPSSSAEAKVADSGADPDASAASAETTKVSRAAARRAKQEAKQEALVKAQVESTLQSMLGETGRTAIVVTETGYKASADTAVWTFDTGASAVFRPLRADDRQEEMRDVQVELALNKSKWAQQTRTGDVISDGAPLYSVGVAVEDAKFSQFWGPSTGMTIAQLTPEAEDAIVEIMNAGTNVMRPRVTSKVPYLTDAQAATLQTERARLCQNAFESARGCTVSRPLEGRELVIAAMDRMRQKPEVAKPAGVEGGGLLKFLESSRLRRDGGAPANVPGGASSSDPPAVPAAPLVELAGEPVAAQQPERIRPVTYDSHAFTHFPFDPQCTICVEANKKSAAFQRGASTGPWDLEQGEKLYTMDFRGPLPVASNGDRWMLVLQRVEDGVFHVHTCPTKKGAVVPGIHAARCELGDAGNKLVIHSDKEPVLKDDEVKLYFRDHEARPHHSIPGVHNTNSRAEAAVQTASRGLRATLLASCAPPKHWPEAMRAWVVHQNIQLGVPPRINTAPRVPFGQMGLAVLPTEIVAKSGAGPRAVPAAHFGYDLTTSGGIRILFRDPYTGALRKTTMLHSNFYARPCMAFKRDVNNLKVTNTFLEAFGAEGEPVIASNDESDQIEPIEQNAEVGLPRGDVEQAALAEVCCKKAFAHEDDAQFPVKPLEANPVREAKIERALRCKVVRHALFGDRSLPDDLQLAGEDLRRVRTQRWRTAGLTLM